MLSEAFKRQHDYRSVRQVTSRDRVPFLCSSPEAVPLQALGRNQTLLQRQVDKQRYAEHKVQHLRTRDTHPRPSRL